VFPAPAEFWDDPPAKLRICILLGSTALHLYVHYYQSYGCLVRESMASRLCLTARDVILASMFDIRSITLATVSGTSVRVSYKQPSIMQTKTYCESDVARIHQSIHDLFERRLRLILQLYIIIYRVSFPYVSESANCALRSAKRSFCYCWRLMTLGNWMAGAARPRSLLLTTAAARRR